MSEPTPTPAATPAATPTAAPTPAPTPAATPAPAPEGDAELATLRQELKAAKDRETALLAEKEAADEAKRQEELTTAEKLAEEKKKREELERKTLIRDTRDELGLVDSIFSHAVVSGGTKEEITADLNKFKEALDAYIEKTAKPVQTPGEITPAPDAKAPAAGQKKSLAQSFFGVGAAKVPG